MTRCVASAPAAIDWRAQVLGNVARVFHVARALHIGAGHAPCARGAWQAVVAFDTSSRAAWRFSALVGLQSLLVALGRSEELVALLDSAAASGTPTGKALQDFSILDELAGADAGEVAERRAAELHGDLDRLIDIRLWFLGVWHVYHDGLSEALAIRDTLTALASVTGRDPIDAEDFLAVRARIAFSRVPGIDSLIRALEEVKTARPESSRRRLALREREHHLRSEIRTRLTGWRDESHRRVSRLAESLSAHIALAGGDTADAIRQLERLVPTAPRPALTWDPWEGLGLEWMLLARLYFARGDLARAVEVARQLDAPASVPNLMYVPASLHLRMRAARELGDAALAEKMRQRLVALGRRDLVAWSQ